ncbi:MAG: recombinase family protein [Ignavibacteriaceae bacterium]|nr:recombinase family protein [Ignavibacteriaceae bacterium]
MSRTWLLLISPFTYCSRSVLVDLIVNPIDWILSFTVDFLTKKRVKNKGIVHQYYVENSHPPIINKEEFVAVQAELERRSNMRGYSRTGKSAFTSEYAFSGKLFCQNCGLKFRRASYIRNKLRIQVP